MSKLTSGRLLLPSVLDRLLDDEPENKREAAAGRNQILRELKKSVRRDLESLLNTRARNIVPAPELKELKQSLVNYGIPDFTALPMQSAKEREDFCRLIQAVLKQFEPRFKTVKVVLLENTEKMDRTLRFRIDGMLHAEPAPEPIVFDSILKPATESFEVKEVSG